MKTYYYELENSKTQNLVNGYIQAASISEVKRAFAPSVKDGHHLFVTLVSASSSFKRG